MTPGATHDIAGTHRGPARSPERALDPALRYARERAHRRRWLAELAELLAFPTVSAAPRHRLDLEAAASWLS